MVSGKLQKMMSGKSSFRSGRILPALDLYIALRTRLLYNTNLRRVRIIPYSQRTGQAFFMRALRTAES